MRLRKSNFYFLLLICFFGNISVHAQSGIYFDSRHSFLIPMMENNILKGHAYVYELDKVSKDSNSFMIQVFDEFLHDVGEKKFMMSSKCEFKAALFNGAEIITKFENEKRGVNYVVFDQQAHLLYDTLLLVKLRNPDIKSESDFQQAPMAVLSNQSTLDYVLTDNGGTLLVCLTRDHQIWTYPFASNKSQSVQFLAGDDHLIVQSVYTYTQRPLGNHVYTKLLVLSAYGVKIQETNLFVNDSTSIYPIAADIDKNGISVISQYTRRAHEFAKVKYGVCLHNFDLNGKWQNSFFNDFTSNLVRDSVFKKYKLMVHSYLYMHKATRLRNGNWLLAAEQFQKTRMKIGLGRNKHIIYNKKNIALFEVDDQAEIVKMHVEPNKPDGARIPRRYYRNPQAGSMFANANGKLDIDYFIRDGNSKSDKIAFVFTDGNYITQKLSLGNIVYRDGDFTVDRFVIPMFSKHTKLAILPARYGHSLLIKLDPVLGLFDFDTIKFNN